MPKTPLVHGTTHVATQPYKGILIGFDFYGMTSDENDQNTIYEEINGETCWILMTDHFTGKEAWRSNNFQSVSYCLDQVFPQPLFACF